MEQWIRSYGIKILNVAGPRANKDKDIYRVTKKILKNAFVEDKSHG
jgi:hypothetical protein